MALTDNAYGQMEIQSELLSMMKEIDAVCRRHGIRYSLLGGSMIGAVREKGFIPWDDDLDLVFTREELSRFIVAFPDESERCTISTTDTWVARVVTREPINGQTPFVDLFHYDWLPKGKARRALKLLTLKLLQGTLKVDTDYSRYSRLNRALLAATHALGKLFPRATKLRWYDRAARIGSPADGRYHVSDDQFHCLGITYAPQCAEGFHDAPFEDATLMLSDEYDAMLRAQYGDGYMTPPPKDKRQPAHEAQRTRKRG